MATAVGLNFKMTASIAKFQASMDKVEQKLKAIEGSSKQTAQGMRLLAAIEIGKSVLSGLTGLFNIFKGGVSSVLSFADEARSAADAIGKLSSSTGMAHEPLQILTRVADHSGVSADQFGTAVQKMSRSLGEAAGGTGAAADALKDLGLDINSLLRMSPDAQFMAIGRAIGELEDPAKKSAAAADIFGRSGVDLVTMFSDLEGSVRDTGTEMADLGQILSGTQIRNIEAMNDAFSDVWQTVKSIGTQLLGNLAPILTAMVEDAKALVKAFEYNGSTGGQAIANYLTDAFFTGAETLAKWVDSARDAFADFFIDMMDFVAEFGKYVSLFTDTKYDGSPMERRDFKNPAAEALERAARQIDEQMSTWGDLFGGGIFGLDDDEYMALQKKRNALLQQAEQVEQEYLDARKKAVVGEGSALDAVRAARESYNKSVENATDRQKQIANDLADAGKQMPVAAKAVEKALDDAAAGLAKAEASADAFKQALDKTSKAVGDFDTKTNASTDTLQDWMKNGFNSSKAMEDLADTVRTAAGVSSVLGTEIGNVTAAEQKRRAATEAAKAAEEAKTRALTAGMSSWDSAADKMEAFWRQQGFSPEYLKQRREAERKAYQERLSAFYDAKKKREDEIAERIKKREDLQKKIDEGYAKRRNERLEKEKALAEQAAKDFEAITAFGKSLNDWFGGGDGEGPEFPEGEETLPELQTQTTTLSGILDAVKDFGKNFTTAIIS